MQRPTPYVSSLLAVALVVGACGAPESRDVDAAGARFELVPSSRSGVTFRNELPENAARNGFTYQYYYNGGGVAVGDLNGDGLPDLYFTANMGPNRLYLNRGGLRFDDVTEAAGVAGLRGGWATGVTFVDIDADGRLDIYVSQSGPFPDEGLRRNLLYVNGGERGGVPVFEERAAAFGLDDPAYTTQAAFFDYDGDGDLDVYLLNHGIPAYRSIDQLASGRSPAEVDRLYRNDGGRFVDVSEEAGLIDTNLGFGLGVSVGDLNNDGHPDLYVANDYSGRDYLYLGQPDGRFREVLEASMGHIPLASMGSDVADIDGDGRLDVAVLEMAMPTHHDRRIGETGVEAERFTELVRKGLHYQYMANALQWNRGVREDGVPVFSEIAYLAGVARSDWSWAALFADLDNDGRPDLFASNGMAGASIDPDFDAYMGRRVAEVEAAEGHVTPALVAELIQNLPRRRVPNHAYRNEGGLTFSDQSTAWGLDQAAYSNGAVYSDLDRDGDLDLVVNNLLGEAFVYRNDSRDRDGAHFLGVELRGPGENPFGVGARVRVVAGGDRQVQEVQLARGYQSSVEPVLHFGLGTSETVDTLEVVWPDGSREVRTGLPADRHLTLDHAAAGPGGAPPDPPVLFRGEHDALSPAPRHHARVSPLDSTLQPYPSVRDAIALAAGDLDGDGLDDFVFGGSGGEPSRVYFQREDGAFGGAALPLAESGHRALAAAVFDADGDGMNDIWLVVADGSGARHRLWLNTGGRRFEASATALPETTGAAETLAAGDYDGDGRTDLFVGSRSVPGRGDAPGSRLLRNEGASFRDVTADAAPVLADLRTVTDALWTDVDGDGAADLVVVGEWMAPIVLRTDDGRLRDVTAAAGLADLSGWWQSVAAADIDHDGDTDIVVGNFGLNHPHHPSPGEPFELYIGDFDGDGDEESVPAYHEDGALLPWFGRSRLASAFPGILERYTTNHAFASATLPEILGAETLGAARRLAVQTLATALLENTGDGRFRSRPLPRAAQLSAATGVVPADFDGDGLLDLVIAGNLHGLDPSVPRLDGGVGLFLRGDGRGGVKPVPPSESGLWLVGEVRRLVQLRTGPESPPALLAAVSGADVLYVRVATPAPRTVAGAAR